MYNKYQKYISYTILSLIGVLMAFPFIWLLTSSLKQPSDIISFPPTLIPKNPTLSSYIGALSRLNILVLYKNSIIIAVSYTALTVFLSSILGYIFAKFQFRGKNIIFIAMLATLVIPREAYVIPLYLLMYKLQWIDTYQGVILPFAFSAYGIFFVRQFVHNIPNDLLDAARIDGAGETYIFFKIVLPLMKPALSALTIFYFLFQWNDFLWPLVVLNSEKNFTLSIGLACFVGEHFANYGVSLAGTMFSILPMLIIFLIFQRSIISGIALTGLKE